VRAVAGEAFQLLKSFRVPPPFPAQNPQKWCLGLHVPASFKIFMH
jgi:hypothetical protein